MIPVSCILRNTVLVALGGMLISSASAQTTSAPATMASSISGASATTTSQVTFSAEKIKRMLDQAETAADKTASVVGIRSSDDQKRPCKFHIFIVDRNGKILGQRSMPDAWTGSIDIALGKARTAAFFSSNENAFSTRQIGMLSLSHEEDGTGSAGGLWGIGNTNQGSGTSAGDVQRNSIVTFPGGLPLYKDGILMGGIGVSGDGVDQDESVAYAGAEGFMPPEKVGRISPLEPKDVDMMTGE